MKTYLDVCVYAFEMVEGVLVIAVCIWLLKVLIKSNHWLKENTKG